MIVRPSDGTLLLITQPDHAHLAGRIMERCARLADHPRRVSILHAVTEHDNGWEEEDAAPLVDSATGAVIDFVNAPLSVRHRVWRRGVSRLAADPWAAALVAQHAVTVYDRFRSDPSWTSFFAGMEAARDELLQPMSCSLDDLLPDYAFVRLADLISLTFCAGWTDEQRFGEWLVRSTENTVFVSPDPFARATLPITITARQVTDQPYMSSGELRRALNATTPITLTGCVVGQEH